MAVSLVMNKLLLVVISLRYIVFMAKLGSAVALSGCRYVLGYGVVTAAG